MASDQTKRSKIIDAKNKLSLKTVIQNMLKNTKNVFTKEEGNQPNDVLLRTIIIKKLIFYLIFAYIALSTSYMGYLTISQQFLIYDFKIGSLFKVTRYHNLTVALLNEYYHREVVVSRPLDIFYTSRNMTDDLTEVATRITSFRDQLNSFDIDINVRQDLFFKDLARTEVSFVIRYAESQQQTQQASKYTILMVMLEKVLTIDNSEFDKEEAFNFIDDNFLQIVNQYLLDSFNTTWAECSKMTADGKVGVEQTRNLR